MVIAGAAPIGVVAGVMPVAFTIGNGAGVPVAFLTAAAILVIFSVGFTAMTPYAAKTGAFYLYVRQGLGPYAGAGTGYAALLSYLLLYAGLYGLLGSAFQALSVSFSGPDLPWWSWAVIALAVIVTLGHVNIEMSGRVLSVLLIAEVAIVLVLDAVIIGNGGGDDGMSTGFLDPGIVFGGSFSLALLFAILGFIGFEATAIFREETRKPERTIPRATYIAVTFIGLFYAVTSWVLVSAIGDARVTQMSPQEQGSMLADLGTEYLGRVGHDLVTVLFATSMFACGLLFHSVVSRYLYSLGRDGLLPRALTRVHPAHKSPYAASLVAGSVVVVVLIASIALRLDPVIQLYTWFSGLAAMGYVSLLLITQIASFRFLRQHIGEVGQARARVFPVISILTLGIVFAIVITSASLLLGSDAAGWTAIVSLAAAYLLGPLVVMLRKPRAS